MDKDLIAVLASISFGFCLCSSLIFVATEQCGLGIVMGLMCISSGFYADKFYNEQRKKSKEEASS